MKRPANEIPKAADEAGVKTHGNRDCNRCVSTAQYAEMNGTPIPPIRSAMTWVKNGIRYYSGICAWCARLERDEREQRKFRLQKDGAR